MTVCVLAISLCKLCLNFQGKRRVAVNDIHNNNNIDDDDDAANNDREEGNDDPYNPRDLHRLRHFEGLLRDARWLHR